jgi:hypothetical protein
MFRLMSPCVRLVVASQFYLIFGGNNGITLFGSIYRAGVNQGIIACRLDGKVGHGRVERQFHMVINWMKMKSAKGGKHGV